MNVVWMVDHARRWYQKQADVNAFVRGVFLSVELRLVVEVFHETVLNVAYDWFKRAGVVDCSGRSAAEK